MKLDARTKLLLVVIITTLSVLARNLIFLSIALFFAILVDIILRVNFILAFKRLKSLLSLIIFISIVQSLTIKGSENIISINNISIITTKGLVFGAEFAIRMSIIIFAGLIATTSKNSEMIDGLILLKIPYEFAFMINIALTFLPKFKEEYSSRLNAIAMRGIEIKKLKFTKKIKLYTYLISPAISGGIIKSRELAISMQAKAFRAYEKRTMLRIMKLKIIDYSIMAISICLAVIFLFFNYTVTVNLS